jgi:hypothetical protein
VGSSLKYSRSRRTPRRDETRTIHAEEVSTTSSTALDLPLIVIHVGSNTSIFVMETLATDPLAAVKIHCTILSVANLCRGSVIVIPPLVVPD